MENLEGFEYCVGLTRKLMNLMGIWPGVKGKLSWYSRCHFLIPLFVMVFFINIPQTRMLFLVYNDLNLFIEVLTTADLLIALTCFKLLGIWYKKEDLNYVLIKMAQDWRVTKKEKQSVMWTNARISRFLTRSFLILTILTVIIYGIQALILMHIKSSKSNFNETTPRQMFLVSKFFFNTEETPIYELCWIFQFLAAITAALAFTSFDSFFIFSILHLCGQMANLRFDVKQLIHQYRTTGTQFADLLGAVVKRHLQLYRFTDCIEENFNKVLLIQMLGFSVTFCLQGYQFVIIMTESNERNIVTIIFIIIFTVTNTSSLFLYCFIVERLKSECIKFSFSIYDIFWYNLKAKDSKMLLNTMLIAKTPFKITGGKFFEFSFEYFMALMKTSLGYLSMLLAVKQRFHEPKA